MHSNLLRVTAATIALAAAVVTVAGVGSTAGIAAAPLGLATMSPTSGTASTEINLLPPPGSSCTGSGSGSPSYRWQTYIVSAAVDASTLTYTSGPQPVAGFFVSPMYEADSGTQVSNRFPSSNPVGLISGVRTMSLQALVGSAITAGEYKVGFACTQAGVLDVGRYWETSITISNVTAIGFDYAVGAGPAETTTTTTTSSTSTTSTTTTTTTGVPQPVAPGPEIGGPALAVAVAERCSASGCAGS